VITALVLLGVAVTFAVSWALSHTILKGEASSLVLELPPYRMPQVARVIYRSLIDRTFFVLRRAVVMAAPAGAITWIFANIYIEMRASSATWQAGCSRWDTPSASTASFSWPSSSVCRPTKSSFHLLMSYLSAGHMLEFASLDELRAILVANGWTWAHRRMHDVVRLLHWPCTTTLLSAYKESGSLKWTFAAFAIPTVIAFTVCFAVAQTARALGLA
jgi:ferrous iron transport protein B